MEADELPAELEALVEKMHDEYVESELEIALALAAADGPLSVDELAEETGYTERTIDKRIASLEDRLGGEPLIQRDDEGRPRLHAAVARALREH
jgi:DNA-binding MarR family transcriptional regulator